MSHLSRWLGEVEFEVIITRLIGIMRPSLLATTENDRNAGVVLASRRQARQHLIIPFIELSYQSVKDLWMRATKIRLLTLIER